MSLRSSSSYKNAAAGLIAPNRYLSDPHAGLELLLRLTEDRVGDTSVGARQHLASLHKLIHHDFVALTARDRYPAEAQAFRDLLECYEELVELAEFPDLANKVIVAVGGGFSAGKSSFLNALLGREALPIDTNPSTSIATYVGYGEGAPTLEALNTFNARSELDEEALKAICHAFHKVYGVGFSHIVRLILMKIADFPYRNLVLLDTPGYNKPDSLIEGDAVDQAVAVDHLSRADHLLWLVDGSKGTVPAADLAFLQSLQLRHPPFVVLTKADLRAFEIEAVLATARMTLEQAGIGCSGMVAFNAHAPGGVEVCGDSLRGHLAALDRAPKQTTRRKDFARIFDAYIAHNRNELNHNRLSLATLNQVAMVAATVLAGPQRDGLRDLISEQRNTQALYGALEIEYQDLRQRVAHCVGKLVGEVALDEDVRLDDADELVVTLTCPALNERLLVGATLEFAVYRVSLFGIFVRNTLLGDCRVGQEQVRTVLVIDPLTVQLGALWTARVRNVNLTTPTMAIVELGLRL